MSVKSSYLVSINAFFLLLSYDLETLKLVINEKDLQLIRNFHVVFWSRNDTVTNYVEVVLKITDNGAAVKKGYIVYPKAHLLPVNNNLSLHLFWSKLQYY